MKAIGLHKYLPIEHEESLLDIEIEKPIPSGKDLLVQVKAISINPVDTKVRAPKEKVEEKPKILGWDASGTVVETGEDCKDFKPGDVICLDAAIKYGQLEFVNMLGSPEKPIVISNCGGSTADQAVVSTSTEEEPY